MPRRAYNTEYVTPTAPHRQFSTPSERAQKGFLEIMCHQGTLPATRGLRGKGGHMDLVFVIVVVVAVAAVFDVPEVPALRSSSGEQTLN